MKMQALIDILSPVRTDDWILVIMLVAALLSFMLIASRRNAFFKFLSLMYKFKNPDSEVNYPHSSPLVFFFQSFFACVSIALMVTCMRLDQYCTTSETLLAFLSFLACFAGVFVIKLSLYQLVNVRLFKKQSITLKPTRWNGFFVSVFSVAGYLSLVLSAVSVFFEVPSHIIAILAILILLLLEIGLVFKIKTAIFRNKCSILIFFLYLCALEIGPIVLMLVILSKLIS